MPEAVFRETVANALIHQEIDNIRSPISKNLVATDKHAGKY